MRFTLRRALPAVAGVVALLAAAPQARAQTGGGDTTIEKAAALVQPATVRLQIQWQGYVNTGSDFGKVGPYDMNLSCSGFGVDPTGYIVTAGHCLDTTLEGAGSDVMESLLADMVG